MPLFLHITSIAAQGRQEIKAATKLSWPGKNISPREIEAPASRSRPGPHAANVHMHEVGNRIISDPAAAHDEGGGMNERKRTAGDSDVDRHSLHMQALGGDAG